MLWQTKKTWLPTPSSFFVCQLLTGSGSDIVLFLLLAFHLYGFPQGIEHAHVVLHQGFAFLLFEGFRHTRVVDDTRNRLF